ncbi:MAG: hypothetical protein ACU843_18810, partial [Gammaproteobacteria bacterium]
MAKFRTYFGFLIYVLVFWISLQSSANATVDLGQLIKTGTIDATLSSSSFNRRTGEQTFNATLTNNGTATVTGPIYYVIESISASNVSVVNNHDVGLNGEPIF